MHEFLHVVEHSLFDTLKMVPFLFVAHFLVEWLAHKAGCAFKNGLRRFGILGPLGGALLGLFPQCGFSIVAAKFYADRVISPGTLIAVFLSTSDEALPILISTEGASRFILPILVVKFIVAILAGFIVDLGFRHNWRPVWERDSELRHNHDEHSDGDSHDTDDDHCTHSHCQGSIWSIALLHTMKVSLLIFIVTVLLGVGLEALGEERMAAFLMQGSFMQPIAAAIFGMIPNCAASVFLTRLYIEESIAFGSVVAGLATGAGIGILVLFQTCRSKREAIIVLTTLFIFGALAGIILG